MTINPRSQTGTNLLQTALAKPYHYRRSGRYYLRLRPQGTTTGFFTLSLRTTDKATAMTISQEILSTLKAYHFDNPAATWEELRERLIEIAESCLTMAHGDSSLVAYEMIHDEHHEALREASAKLPLSVNQQRAVGKALEIIEAAQERLKGRPGKLVEIVRDLKGESCGTPVALSPSLSVLPSEPLTFKALSALYMDEHKEYAGAKTVRDTTSDCKTISEILGDLDMKNHTREDMKNLRAKLLEGRTASTVKKILTRLSTVMKWAVNNDYLTKALTEGLKPTKGAESSRKAFSQDQVKALMAYAKALPVDAWQRWALSLGVIAGTRIEELRQLTKADVKQIGDVWVIDINRNDGKTAKTKNALRVIPLTDGAYGFDLKAFLEFVQGADSRLFSLGAGRFSELLNGLIRDVLGVKADRTQTFHSLRHSLAGALKAAEIPVGTAESILGHASGSISYDVYGAGSAVEVGRMADALGKAFSIAK
ncbi:tyrosine-type recombinase/integrase [Pseudomonas sp. P66]|uniref:Tyrosine-type recombinase/integrase n=1 Tax=Pseudomonas arcuscaelestis TaxID=2710591 RepID=A0ABS2C2B5_9PSED|nr:MULTISPECIES: tyrosine-type recombinase/integrase [Pseudomonas]EKT4455634.1 tyrosine-type recombinase/integrase [Pseudomonas putida]EKT4512956.1 tyrosine-type recombinase/integrase [Pseudomonas putida]EKT4566433.1 tyrosine-type recombinase/integrase [Pseudomonas putida]MBA6110869.1 tyrosine-type recombinase/integrase [Pseudomonas asiatica]MBM5460033.1 tyrosine-type recombinase/integrase [Pseudomonas arcuscaelestis]